VSSEEILAAGKTSESREQADSRVIELELDENGAPVSVEPRGWFSCFVPGLLKHWWYPFCGSPTDSPSLRN